MRITLAVAAACMALGWVASKLHTVASKKWVPMKHHDHTVRMVAMNAKREETRQWQTIN